MKSPFNCVPLHLKVYFNLNRISFRGIIPLVVHSDTVCWLNDGFPCPAPIALQAEYHMEKYTAFQESVFNRKVHVKWRSV